MSDHTSNQPRLNTPGVKGNGQFTYSRQGEAEFSRGLGTQLKDRPETTVESVVDSIKSGAYFTGDLVYVDRDDALTDEQQSAYLAGDWETFDNSVDESYSDRRYDRVNELAGDASEKLGLDWDELDDEEQDAIKEAMYDKDQSNPTPQLLRNTGSKLIRVPLASPYEILAKKGDYDATRGSSSMNSDDPRGRQARIDTVAAILKEHGVDTADATVIENLNELIDNGPYDWHEAVTLDVITYADLAEASALPHSDADAPGATGRNLTFSGAHVVLLDPWNGSGHDVQIPGNLGVTVTPDKPAVLDRGGNGYGWDEVAGVVHSAYRPDDIKSEWVTPETPTEASQA